MSTNLHLPCLSPVVLRVLVGPKTVPPTAKHNGENSYKKDFVDKDCSHWQCHKQNNSNISVYCRMS